MENIEVINLGILNEKEKAIADKLFNEYYSKIQRLVKTPLSLRIDIKEYKKEGKGKKFSLNAEAVFSGGKLISSSAWDWNLAKAIHKLMKKIENEIEKKFKISRQY